MNGCSAQLTSKGERRRAEATVSFAKERLQHSSTPHCDRYPVPCISSPFFPVLFSPFDCRLSPCCSVHLRPRFLHHPRPLREVRPDDFRELFGSAADHVGALRSE